MKKIILSIAIIAASLSNTSFAQNVHLNQQTIIPIGLGSNGQKLESIQLTNAHNGIKYTLETEYNNENEVERLSSNCTTHHNLNSSMSITLNKVSDTQRVAVISTNEEEKVNVKDSIVMNYNLAGLPTSQELFTMSKEAYVLKESINWVYPNGDTFYSVNSNNERVDYVATNGMVKLATSVKGNVQTKIEYQYDNSNVLSGFACTTKDTGKYETVELYELAYEGIKDKKALNGEVDMNVVASTLSSTIFMTSELTCKVAIYDMDGVHVKDVNTSCNEIIRLTGVSNGNYIVKIKDSLGGKETRWIKVG